MGVLQISEREHMREGSLDCYALEEKLKKARYMIDDAFEELEKMKRMSGMSERDEMYRRGMYERDGMYKPGNQPPEFEGQYRGNGGMSERHHGGYYIEPVHERRGSDGRYR